MKKILPLIILIAILLAAVITCPDEQQHHEVLKNAWEETMNTAMKATVGDDTSVFGLSLGTFGATLASRLIGNVVESTLTFHDYFVFSTSEVTVAGKTRTVSIGLFGHVFPTFDVEDVKKAIAPETP